MANLLFCMTPGMGLKDWQDNGSLKRELIPYLEYARQGWTVKVLTFDTGAIPDLPEGLEVVRFPSERFLWFLPWLRRDLGSWADIIKTNQSTHAYFYTWAASLWRKPVLLRCGYIYGKNLENIHGSNLRVKLYQWLEKKAFNMATHCQVPTEELAEWICAKYKIPKNRISVTPNFVDTSIFAPEEKIRKDKKSVISIGRLDSVKRFDILIRACARIPGVKLTIIGQGPQREDLKNLAQKLNLNLELPGNVPNEELPKILNRHEVFAIASEWEGNPKVLIEAMACGKASVGANTPGINTIIRHGWNGLLCQPDPKEFTDAINRLFEDTDFTKQIEKNAVDFTRLKYSSDIVFNDEKNNIERILNLIPESR